MKRLIILSVVIASILYSKEDKVIVSINGLESAGLSKRYINYAQYTIQELSIDLEETVSKMIGDKYSINIHFTAYESVENTINIARDSLSIIIKTIKDKYPDEDLVTHSISHPYNGIQGVIIGKVQIQVNIDNSINLNKSIDISNRSSEYFDWIFMDFQDCQGCVSFNNVDMDSIDGKNTISLTRIDIYDDSWAVIIGIDEYQNISNLDYAVNDAESVKKMLINQFSYEEENVKLLINEDANRDNIAQAISDISLLAGENDRILVFFAGHGETMKLPDGGEMGYLLPVDGRQENLYASAIPMNDLKDLSNMSKAKHMLFLVDACYGGLAAVGSRGLEPAKTPNYIEKITKIKSRQIITAGGKDEEVFEKSEWGHSAYTKNLLSALKDGYADSNGDGYITADELGDYLSEKVSIDSENQQTPQSRRLTSHEGEFIFIAKDMQINIINTVEKNEVHTKKLDRVLLNNEQHDIGIKVFGLGLFSGSDKKIINEKVKGGLLVSIFGNANLNLVHAELNQGENIIKVIVLFGGCTILVPPEMYVDTQVLPIFGSFKNKNDYIIEDGNQANKKLIVRGVTIFGGGSVRNEKWYDNMGNW